jgi:hypothetical protein
MTFHPEKKIGLVLVLGTKHASSTTPPYPSSPSNVFGPVPAVSDVKCSDGCGALMATNSITLQYCYECFRPHHFHCLYACTDCDIGTVRPMCGTCAKTAGMHRCIGCLSSTLCGSHHSIVCKKCVALARVTNSWLSIAHVARARVPVCSHCNSFYDDVCKPISCTHCRLLVCEWCVVPCIHCEAPLCAPHALPPITPKLS